MANECLVTKLKGIVDNDNLPIMGALRLQVDEQASPTAQTQWFYTPGGTIEVPAAHPMTDATHLDNGSYEVLVKNKYNITAFSHGQSVEAIDIAELKYCTQLQNLTGHRMFVGDIANVSKWTSLKELSVTDYQGNNLNIYGDISVFANTPSLQRIQLIDSNITGNIAVFANTPNLQDCYLRRNKISGNINVFSNCANLQHLALVSCTDVVGDIAALAGKSLATLTFGYQSGIYGDVINLGSNTALEEFSITGTSVTGEVIDFVAAQVAAGRTTKEPTSSWSGFLNRLTFGGVVRIPDTSNPWTFVSWDGTKIIVYVGATDYQNAPKIYARNATQQEISTWEAAGKEVTVIS